MVGKIAIYARRVANQCAEAGPLFLLAAGKDSAPAVEPANRKVLDGDSTGRKAGTLLRSPECGTPVLADGPDGNSGNKRIAEGVPPLNAQGMVLDVDLLDPVAGGPVPATPGGQPTGGNFIPVAHKYVRSVKQIAQCPGCGGTGIISLGSTRSRRKASACSGVGRATIANG